MYIFIKGQKNKKLLPLCGLFLSFATLSRFPNILITFLFFLYIFFLERRFSFTFIKYTIPPMLFFIWYQLNYPGNIFFYKYEALGEIARFNNSFTTGFFGLLIAPNKGLFIYSPIFIFTILGIIISFIKKLKVMLFFSVLVIVYITFVAKWSAWHGGWSYGPRMLADITPFLTLLIVPVLRERKILSGTFFKLTFTLTAFLSIYIHMLGVTVANFSWYYFQTRNLTLEQSHQAAFLWNWNFPEIYYFYLAAEGFFGSIKVLTIELVHIAFFIIKGSTLLVIAYLLLYAARARLKSNN